MIFLSLIMARGGACTKPPAALFFFSFLSRNCTQTEPSFWKRTKERVEKFARNYFASAFWRNKRTELEENWGGFEIFKEMLGRKRGGGKVGYKVMSGKQEVLMLREKRKPLEELFSFLFSSSFLCFPHPPPHRGEGGVLASTFHCLSCVGKWLEQGVKWELGEEVFLCWAFLQLMLARCCRSGS